MIEQKQEEKGKKRDQEMGVIYYGSAFQGQGQLDVHHTAHHVHEWHSLLEAEWLIPADVPPIPDVP